MPNHYNNDVSSSAFQKYINSEDGKIQQQLLYDRLLTYLETQDRILDAACGFGWLSGRLSQDFKNSIEAFDSSEPLIREAKKLYPEVNFQVADATGHLPYPHNHFDKIVLNMAAPDLPDLATAFGNLHKLLKPGGLMIVTLGNPYYAFPVGVWKRGLKGFLLRQKPRLKVRPYHEFHRKKNQLFSWRQNMSSYFYPLSEYITRALAAGFSLKAYEDLELPEDSAKFDSRHQLYRYPTILLLAFEKRGE